MCLSKFKELRENNEIKLILKNNALEYYRQDCKCYFKFSKHVVCFMIRSGQKNVKKIIKITSFNIILVHFFRILKSLVNLCTPITYQSNGFYYENKGFCLKCFKFISKSSKSFLQLFNVVKSKVDEFITELRTVMKNEWSKCRLRCYGIDFIRLEIEFEFARHYSSKCEVYLSPFYENVRKKHGELRYQIIEAAYAACIDSECNCFPQYLKVVVSILLDNHVDNVSFFFNPETGIIEHCIKYYKISQRLYNDYKQSDFHKLGMCGNCLGGIYFTRCYHFVQLLFSINDENSMYRPMFLFDDVVIIWEKCPLKCINNYKEPRGDDEDYSVTINDAYHNYVN